MDPSHQIFAPAKASGSNASVPLRRPRFLHDFAVAVLIKWRTAGGELAQRMVLLPHEIRAERQRLADSALVEIAFFQRIGGEIRIRQRAAADP